MLSGSHALELWGDESGTFQYPSSTYRLGGCVHDSGYIRLFFGIHIAVGHHSVEHKRGFKTLLLQRRYIGIGRVALGTTHGQHGQPIVFGTETIKILSTIDREGHAIVAYHVDQGFIGAAEGHESYGHSQSFAYDQAGQVRGIAHRDAARDDFIAASQAEHAARNTAQIENSPASVAQAPDWYVEVSADHAVLEVIYKTGRYDSEVVLRSLVDVIEGYTLIAPRPALEHEMIFLLGRVGLIYDLVHDSGTAVPGTIGSLDADMFPSHR